MDDLNFRITTAVKEEGSGTFPDPQTHSGLRGTHLDRSPELRPRRWKAARQCNFGGKLQAKEGTALLAKGRESLLDVRGVLGFSRIASAVAGEWMRLSQSCCHARVLFKEEREGEVTAWQAEAKGGL